MLYAIFEGPTSPTYGASAERPIISILDVPDVASLVANLKSGEYSLEIPDVIDTDYYKITKSGVNWVLTPRATIPTLASWDKLNIVANGVDTASFGPNLPVGLDIGIYVPANSGIITDGRISVIENSGTFRLTTNAPGIYTIDILAQFPYAPYKQTIVAT